MGEGQVKRLGSKQTSISKQATSKLIFFFCYHNNQKSYHCVFHFSISDRPINLYAKEDAKHRNRGPSLCLFKKLSDTPPSAHCCGI
uniref:Uncharacterized protein n=1 Tax=Neogobius melanostomus TaxID=47308 RepID=A0A8C6SDW5_9GOBI